VVTQITVLLEPAEERGLSCQVFGVSSCQPNESKQETLSNIKEAIEGYLEVKAKLLDLFNTKDCSIRAG